MFRLRHAATSALRAEKRIKNCLMNHPLLLALLTVAGIYLGKLWRDDACAAAGGAPHPNALPGATRAPARTVAIAVIGALAIVAAETYGERVLGVSGEQSHVTWLFAAYSIMGAPIIEEIIFRGWIVIGIRGRPSKAKTAEDAKGVRDAAAVKMEPLVSAVTWLGAIGASVVFALLHPFLWRWDDAGFVLTFGAKGWFSVTAVFATSLWLYIVRLAAWNPQRSLLPCFAGHAAKNIAVVAIKAAMGFVGGVF
jgi:uncharacterized protein